MSIGDHLRVRRFGYFHHGIQVAIDRVVHYSGLARRLSTGPVQEVSLEDFADGRPVRVMEYDEPPWSPEEIVDRARSRIGEDLYRVLGMNCEHFAGWCVTGRHSSTQVDVAATTATVAKVAGAGAGAGVLVSTAGTVGGLSGPGIMTGLVAVGPGGAVGGAATLAGGAGLGAALLLNNTVLADHPQLEEQERRARSAGRKATVVGATGAAAGGVVAIGAAGSVAGLSGAGIMSGLASIGTTAGVAGVAGSAAVGGVVVVAAAPVAAAAALGLGIWALLR